MSSSVMRMRLHELFSRLPRNVSTHQMWRNFTISCTHSRADDRGRGSWYKTTPQESSGRQRQLEDSTEDEFEFESSDSRSFPVTRPRITQPAMPMRDDPRMEERPRFRKRFEQSQESVDDEEPGFWPTQGQGNRMNYGEERTFPGHRNDRWTERRPDAENYVRPRKWLDDRPAKNYNYDNRPAKNYNYDNRPAKNYNYDNRRARNYNYDERPAKNYNYDNRRAKNFNYDDRPAKNYNYGLTGLGKELPQKLGEAPPVKGEILYGIHSVLLALLAARRDFHKVYVRDTLVESEKPALQQIMALAREKEIDFEVCKKSVLASLSQARPHQGVCLDAGHLDFETLDSCESFYEDSSSNSLEPQLFVILDSVQDPMNLGAVIRSSYFLGVDQLFVVKDNSCSLTPVVSKSSAGAMEINKIYAIPDLIAFLEDFKERGWDLLGTTSSSKSNPGQVVSLRDVSLKRNTILILGNEGSGLAENIESRCHQLVTIPPGRSTHHLVDCLNVSVATGIMLHHLCQFKTPPQRPA